MSINIVASIISGRKAAPCRTTAIEINFMTITIRQCATEAIVVTKFFIKNRAIKMAVVIKKRNIVSYEMVA